jgi:hypothetical protein
MARFDVMGAAEEKQEPTALLRYAACEAQRRPWAAERDIVPPSQPG